MGLSWQQGPLGRDPNGTFLSATPMPERMLYIEPLRRRMSVGFGDGIVARSDDAVLLFEPARYPVAYFPVSAVAAGVLRSANHETTHPDLGRTAWFDVVAGDGHVYHRIDIRRSSRHLVARAGDDVVADTHAPLVLYESGFAPRWYVPRADVVADALEPVPGQTVISHGPDRNLSVEVGGIQLVEEPVSVSA